MFLIGCDNGINNESDEEFAGNSEYGSVDHDDELDIDIHEVDAEADRDFSVQLTKFIS